LVGGCFAAVLLWRLLYRRRRWLSLFGRMLCRRYIGWSGGCFATLFVLLISAPLAL